MSEKKFEKVELDTQQRHWFRVYASADAEAAEQKVIADEAKAELAATLPETGNLLLTIDGVPVRKVERTTVRQFASARFREDHPTLREEYTEERTQTQFKKVQ